MSHDHAPVAEEEYPQTLFWLHEVGLTMPGANGKSATPPVSATLARGIELEWGRGQSAVAQSTAQLDWLAAAGVPPFAAATERSLASR